MSIRTRLISLIVILAGAAGLGWLATYYSRPADHLSQHETLLVGQNRFEPGSRAALRVVVRDTHDSAPLPGAKITVSLQSPGSAAPTPLFAGVTDPQGNVPVAFQVPSGAEGQGTLIVETVSRLGSDRLTQPVTLARNYRLLLTTDKPLYQPGQVIHLRALALSTFDLTPAMTQTVQIAIADGKGNRVFSKALTTSDFGVASTDFPLAAEVNTGAYKITATLGQTASEKTVTVEHYSLPKFAVALATERPYYLPGEHVRGTLQANYFFGKPVGEGAVTLEGFSLDVARTVAFTLQGTTDLKGNYSFEFDLPGYLAGSDLDNGQGRFYVQATVIDQAQQAELANLSLPVSTRPLVIKAIPESGQFRPGVENLLYVLVSAPDGTPVPADLTIRVPGFSQPLAAATDAYGMAEVPLTPASPSLQLTIEARAKTGASASQDFTFLGSAADGYVLLRPDRAVYQVGETMQLSLLASQPGGTVYLDIVRDGQTVSTQAVVLGQAGQAQIAVDLTPDLFGTLELHAYKILPSSAVTRDTRLVVVDAANDLAVSLTPGQATYRPGDRVGLDLQVNGAEGAGVQSAVGLAIVDESVFALADQDPGFAKLYFLLEQELRQPRYDLHGASLGSLMSAPPAEAVLQNAQENAAQAALADAAARKGLFSLQANSHEVALQRVGALQAAHLETVGASLSWLALSILGLSAFTAWREKRLAVSIAVAFMGTFALGYGACLLLSGETPPVVLLAALGLGLVPVTLAAWKHNSWLRLMTAALTLAHLTVLANLVWSGSNRLGFWSTSISVEMALGTLLMLMAVLMQLVGVPHRPAKPTASLTSILLGILLLLNGCSAATPMAAPAPTSAPAQPTALAQPATAGSGVADPGPRLRQYFPETLLWLPEAVTDPKGHLHVDFPAADSITTWRMTALASTRDGRLGSAVGSLRVFQDFFIDLTLPGALTVGDEVSIPVGVFNYLPQSQTVHLTAEPAPWYALAEAAEKEITLDANEVGVVYFRLRAVDFGLQAFKVTARGSQMSDAIQKNVQVFPNGRQFFFTQSDQLTPGSPVTVPVAIPAEAIPGSQAVSVKLYPGVASQVVEGLDSLLRMPNGCFEQTSSTTYPNVLVLDYLRRTRQAAPAIEMKAEQYLNLGYQRLTTFEVANTGGFSLFGQAPADRMLTAYGLQEFSDMQNVQPVDPALVQRAANWLLSQQQADGAWVNDRGLVHESTWRNLQNDQLPVTAYIVWSLTEAGLGHDTRTQRGLAYVRDHRSQATDPYVLALVANALVAADQAGDHTHLSPDTEAVLNQLAEMAYRQGAGASWPSGIATFMGAQGQTGSIETTALVALAFLRSNRHPDLATAALTMLVREKDAAGTWYTTQATVLALKALLQSVEAGSGQAEGTVSVMLNGHPAGTVTFSPETANVVQVLSLAEIPVGAGSTLALHLAGKGGVMYQVSGSYYLPWDKAAEATGQPAEPLTIQVAYGRSTLSVNDTVSVNVTVTLNGEGRQVDSALIDLGLPPGFDVQADELSARVAHDRALPAGQAGPTLERYDVTGRQILVYANHLSAGQPFQFGYRLKAKYPLVAQTPASTAYDYYNPEVAGEVAPRTLQVTP